VDTKRFVAVLGSAIVISIAAMGVASCRDKVIVIRPVMCSVATPVMMEREQMIRSIIQRHRIDSVSATQIVDLAYKYQDDTFPRAHDIVAIIGIESEFKSKAKSKLRHDPAIGLTQIRPKAWSHVIKRSELSTIEGQVKYGAYILHAYYKSLENKENAVVAYNIGLKAFRRGDDSPNYLTKYRREYGNYIVNGES
jgi:hypothetical protein